MPRRPELLALSVLAVASPLVASATARAADFTFANPNGGALNDPLNWLPTGVPGAADNAQILGLPTITGILPLTLPVNQTIGRVTYGYFGQATVDGPGVLTLQSGQLNFTDAITEQPNTALTSLFLRSVVAGGSGLTKTGPGFVLLQANNLYTGGTTILGPGGITASSDAAFGAAGTAITLDGGTIRAASAFTSARPIVLGAGGGRFETFGTLTLNGTISGTGSLTSARFLTNTSLRLGGVNTYGGATHIDNGSTLTLLGRATATASVRLAGTLNLGEPTVGPSVDAINNTAPINSFGGRVNVYAGAAGTAETLGTLNLRAGTTTLHIEPTVNGGVQLNFAGITRTDRSTAFVRGRDLGNGVAAANRANVTFADVTNLPMIGGTGATATSDPIVPFLLGNANATGGVSQVSTPEAGFVTRGPSGLRVLDGSDYATTPGVAANDNVRLTDGAYTQNAAATMNSLLIRDTLTSEGPTGVGGGGLLTIASGAIAAVSDRRGDELFIDNPVNFGAAEGVVHTAPTFDGHSSLTMRGAIGGFNGLTKSGVGNLGLESTASTYTGTTTINAGLVDFAGNVTPGVAGALGSASSDVIINAGSSGNAFVGLRARTPGSTFARNILVRQNAATNSLAYIGTAGGFGATYSGTITVEGGYLNVQAEPGTPPLTISGRITGAGGLQDATSSGTQTIRLTGPNDYTGGTILRGGTFELGSPTAFGSGTVYVTEASGIGSISAVSGPQTIANPFVFRGVPVFGGTDALTLSGPVDLGGANREVRVTNTAADTTFANVVSRGGITKSGAGRLILSAANTYNGQTLLTGGVLRVVNSSGLGQATAQTAQATFVTGAAALELSGGINTAESIYLGADTLPVTAAVAGGNLRSVSGNNTVTGSVAFDNVGTIGVDGGSALTLAGETLDNTADATAVLRKVGGGTLAVRNVRLSGLEVNEGTVRVTPAGAPLGTSRVSTLDVAAGAQLDLTNNALVLDYAVASPIAAIRTALAHGRIVTSVATPGAAVGYGEATAIFPGASFPQSYAGQSFDASTLLLTQTLRGDADLDRVVNFDDLLVLAQNYGTGANAVWTGGDFTYNGTVDFDDLLALAQNYGRSGAVADLAGLTSAAFAADWAMAQSLVPEPVSLLAPLGLMLLARRRRRPGR